MPATTSKPGPEAPDQEAAVTAIGPCPGPTGHGFYSHLRVGDCDIAVPLAHTVQAMRLPAAGLRQLPRRRGALAGLVDLDGMPVPVIALDRWVPVGQPGDLCDARIVILRSGRSLLAIQVDALLGIERVEAASIRRVHRVADAEELFESVASPSADRPLLCLLEVERLMALADAWCEDAEVVPAVARSVARARRGGVALRHAIVVIGGDCWAVPAAAIVELARVPKVEMRRVGQRVCGIGRWSGRKLPIVDLAADRESGDPLPASMVVITRADLWMALVVTGFDRFIDLPAESVAPTPSEELRAGTAVLEGLGMVSVLDVGKLFAAVPESLISRVDDSGASRPRAASATQPGAGPADGSSHYLVFETDRRYASPIVGMLGVVALAPPAIEALAAGRPATLVWRGRTLRVLNLPSIDGGSGAPDPRMAVIVEGPDADAPCAAIAVRSLCDWLPAATARRGAMRSPGAGEISMITAERENKSVSLVVVDLPQMAYFLT